MNRYSIVCGCRSGVNRFAVVRRGNREERGLLRLFMSPLWLLLLALCAACGGGGGGSSAPPPPAPPPVTPTEPLGVLDALPRAGAMGINPVLEEVVFSHLGYADFALQLSGGCAGDAVLRSARDLSVDYDQLIEHRLVCDALGDNATTELSVLAERDNGDRFEVETTFSTGAATPRAVVVQDGLETPAAAVRNLFQQYVDVYLDDELELPGAVRFVLEPLITEIAELAWSNLLDPDAGLPVRSERVAYTSRTPGGEADARLTGLIAYPQTADRVRDEIIVLMHSTGVTPSDLQPSNAWWVLANLFASQGYLVIAPDNWGRGGTEAEEETYLLGNRTAANAVDLVRAVLASGTYDGLFSAAQPTLHIVGYSQGGHSAVALWLALLTQAPDLTVGRVFAGGAPLDLYATVRGAVQFAAGQCAGDAYCRYVDDETSVPFVTERILPPYIAYTGLSFTLADAVEGDALRGQFAEDFLANAATLDGFKSVLQQSSYTNLLPESLAATSTTIDLYHSPFDRLVASANSDDFISALGGRFDIRRNAQACAGLSYEAIFAATDIVGISHALCGFEMLDAVYDSLR